MKKPWPIFILAILVAAAAGCTRNAAKTPDGSTGELAPLYSALHEIVLLNRQQKAGKISTEDHARQSALLEKKIKQEFDCRRQKVWDYSLNILKKTPISRSTQNFVTTHTPVAHWQARDLWADEQNPLPAMYGMLPLQMTTALITPAFTAAEQNNFKYAFRPVQVLYLDDLNCTTAFLFGNKISTVDFKRTGLRWKPGEIRLYLNPAQPDSPAPAPGPGQRQRNTTPGP